MASLFKTIFLTTLIPKRTMASGLRKVIFTEKAPKPFGPYSQAVVFDKTIYVSGLVGMNKDTNKLVDGGVVAQAQQALQILGVILAEAGSSYGNVVKTTIFMQDLNDFAAMNNVYKEYFRSDFPARSTFQVVKLPLGAKVEIEVIAMIN